MPLFILKVVSNDVSKGNLVMAVAGRLSYDFLPLYDKEVSGERPAAPTAAKTQLVGFSQYNYIMN